MMMRAFFTSAKHRKQMTKIVIRLQKKRLVLGRNDCRVCDNKEFWAHLLQTINAIATQEKGVLTGVHQVPPVKHRSNLATEPDDCASGSRSTTCVDRF